MNQSKFLAITCNSLKPREKSRVQSAIGFGFASHWLKNWRESFKPITKRSNRNHVITFDSHLKTALTLYAPNVMASTRFDHSTKDTPLPSANDYKRKLIEKTELLYKRMRWKAFFYLNLSAEGSHKTITAR